MMLFLISSLLIFSSCVCAQPPTKITTYFTKNKNSEYPPTLIGRTEEHDNGLKILILYNKEDDQAEIIIDSHEEITKLCKELNQKFPLQVSDTACILCNETIRAAKLAYYMIFFARLELTADEIRTTFSEKIE